MKRLFSNLLLSFVSLLAGFFILEGLMRVMEAVTRPAQVAGVVDALGFEKLQPNFDGPAYSHELDRNVHVKTNAEGFVGHDYPLEKSPDTVRVALLGDSFVDARTVDWEESFAHQMEITARQRWPDKNFEFMNFGISGADTLTEMLYYQHYAVKYKPDYVVLFFYPNDFEGNKNYLTAEKSEWLNIRPQTYGRPSGLKAKILSSSVLVSYLDNKVKNNFFLVRLAVKIGLYGENILNAVPQEGIHPTFFMYREPLSESNLRAYDLTPELIGTLKNLAHENDSEFILVYLPEARQVDKALWEQLRADVPKLNEYQWNLRHPNDFLVRHYPDMLDLTAAFEKHFDEHPNINLYNRGADSQYRDGHLSEDGHKLTSQAFLDFFEKIIEDDKR
ncbi:hypothetical protein A2671_00160 [Candidatus Kaiserbacteria bacterium RIFCSPHIGHO2_01_FULL_49_13]|uniref:SGNH hydrolase-type esterase domain-containing protein n=1 Tax=Candidatus Kaiserbacteria bacterium RIFCSPHIGHO2_01_FULL_49_13 TaxID=1798477 RepID=A0A1F6CE05_9BACT|nr:MAG: hypothetical protein A2671_00160 [Candidatus Kaiserbacteria bacterium RIFCSPHIGHO2_01_FULL_49_13]